MLDARVLQGALKGAVLETGVFRTAFGFRFLGAVGAVLRDRAGASLVAEAAGDSKVGCPRVLGGGCWWDQRSSVRGTLRGRLSTPAARF